MTDRPPSVRHGYHFALKAEAASLEANPLSADLFSTVPPSPIAAKRGLRAALHPSASAGAFVAQKLALPEGKRLRSLNKADDIKWVLEDRRKRDDFSKITAHALRRNILLLAPAAKALRQCRHYVGDAQEYELLHSSGEAPDWFR